MVQCVHTYILYLPSSCLNKRSKNLLFQYLPENDEKEDILFSSLSHKSASERQIIIVSESN